MRTLRYQPTAPPATLPGAFQPRIVEPSAPAPTPPPATIVPMPPQPSTEPPAVRTTPKKLGSGLNFGGIKKKAEATSKTDYPVFTGAGAGELAAQVIDLNDQADDITARLEAAKAELKGMITPFYFGLHAGRPGEPASSVSVFDAQRREVLVSFTKALSKKALADSRNLAILGDRAEEFFRPGFEITLDGDAIPADRAQAILDELNDVFTRHGLDPAGVMTVKELIKPVPEFHTVRHTALDVATNLALNQSVPMTIAVKVARGRK